MVALAFVVTPQEGKAQVAMTNPNALALDTATQAAAEGPVLAVKSSKKIVTIVLKTTKISGTIAGTVQWQGSLDGTNYATIDSISLTDASTNYTKKFTDNGYLYYKALITQTGTSSLSYAAKLFATALQ